MKIHTHVVVKDGAITIELDAPVGLPEGTHSAWIEIAEETRPAQKLIMPPALEWANWPKDEMFNREDIYDEGY